MRLVVCLALTAPAIAQDVWVVDENGGGDFVEIQDAVDAATQRDTILVKDGFYPGFAIINKSLQVVSEVGAQVRVTGAIMARNLPYGRDVLLSGLEGRFVLGSVGGSPQGGAVLVQDCASYLSFSAGPSAPAVEIGSFIQVVAFVDGDFTGRSYLGFNPKLDGGHGLSKPTAAFTRILAYHTRFRGGQGGDGQSLACFPGGDGGDAVRLAGGALVTEGVVALPGSGGNGCNPGEDGVSYRIFPPATVTPLATPASRLTLPALLREGQPFDVVFEAPPGTQVALVAAGEMQARDLGPNIGVLVPESPITVVPLGVVPANGLLVVPMTAPQLAAGDESRRWFYQGMVVQAGARFLSNPRALVVIDDAL